MRRTLVAAVLAASGLACQPGTSGPRLELDAGPATVDEVRLRWRQPTSGDFSAFVVEGRQVPGSFRALAVLSPTTVSYRYTFPASVPELTDHEFRVRALPEPGGERVSAPVSFHRGLRSPVVVLQGLRAPFTLAIQNVSELADGLELAREVFPCGVRSSPEPPQVLPRDVSTWVDPDEAAWRDGTWINYRVTALKGGTRSAETVRATFVAPLAPPSGPTFTSVTEGLQVDYANQSRCATRLEVWRTRRAGAGSDDQHRILTGQGVGTHAQVVFPAAAPGIFEFEARASLTGWDATSSEAWWVSPLDGLASQVVPTPRGTILARTASGAFASAGGSPDVTLRAPGTAGEDVLVRAGATLDAGNLQADAEGNPHAVLVERQTGSGGLFDVVHAWHDGTAWHVETVATTVGLPFPRLAVGPEGTVHVAWPNTGVSGRVELARRRAGAWESLEPLAPSKAWSTAPWGLLAGDDQGRPHVVVPEAGPVLGVESWYEASGWTSAPLAARTSSTQWLLAIQARPGGLVAVTRDTSTLLLAVRERVGAAWGGETVLGSLSPSLDVTVRTAHTVDGARLLVAIDAAHPEGEHRLFVHDAGGTVERSWLAVSRYPRTSAAGFAPGGKAWVLENTSDAPPQFALPTFLFEEL